jgi:hypothetical protein
MSPELDAELKSSEETVLEVKRILNRDKTSDDEQSTVVVAFIDQAIEHHAAILLLDQVEAFQCGRSCLGSSNSVS